MCAVCWPEAACSLLTCVRTHIRTRTRTRTGVVARPLGNFKSAKEYHYTALKMNVDMLKLIQLGLTLTDEIGRASCRERVFPVV